MQMVMVACVGELSRQCLASVAVTAKLLLTLHLPCPAAWWALAQEPTSTAR